MSLESLYDQFNIGSEHLESHGESRVNPLPPVETWKPKYCGEIDIQIKANGDWYHEGSVIKRLALTRLFSTVLWREVTDKSDDYFLVTPVEKVKISVEDTPFILTQWHWQDETQQAMVVSTSLGDEFLLDQNHPMELNAEGHLYVTVRKNLLAKVHRNVYYQWIELAEETQVGEYIQLTFTSALQYFVLGDVHQA